MNTTFPRNAPTILLIGPRHAKIVVRDAVADHLGLLSAGSGGSRGDDLVPGLGLGRRLGGERGRPGGTLLALFEQPLALIGVEAEGLEPGGELLAVLCLLSSLATYTRRSCSQTCRLSLQGGASPTWLRIAANSAVSRLISDEKGRARTHFGDCLIGFVMKAGT